MSASRAADLFICSKSNSWSTESSSRAVGWRLSTACSQLGDIGDTEHGRHVILKSTLLEVWPHKLSNVQHFRLSRVLERYTCRPRDPYHGNACNFGMIMERICCDQSMNYLKVPRSQVSCVRKFTRYRNGILFHSPDNRVGIPVLSDTLDWTPECVARAVHTSDG